jgi:hypothetical protein
MSQITARETVDATHDVTVTSVEVVGTGVEVAITVLKVVHALLT